MSSLNSSSQSNRLLDDRDSATTPLGVPRLGNFAAFHSRSDSELGSTSRLNYSSTLSPSSMRESSASRRSDTPTPSKGSKKKKLSTEEKREKEELKRIDKELKQKQKQLKKEEKKRRQSYTSSSRRSSSTPNEVQVTHYDEKETSHNAANTSGTAVFNVPDAAALLQSEKDKSNSQINDEDFRWEFAQFVKNIMQSEYLTKNNNTNRVTMVLLRNSFECDYIILMTNTLQVKRYLLKLLLIFSNKKVPVYTTTLSPREATASDYCFNVEVCLTEGSTDLSLHLTVRPEMKNSFYKHYSKYYNNKFTKFSIDPLFPVDTTNIQVDCLNDARKRRLLYYVIKEMIYEDYYIFDNSVGSLNMNNSSIIYAADDESCNNTSQGSPNGSMTHLAVHNTNVIQLLNEINEQLTKVQEEEERQRQQADNEVELALLKNAKIVSHDNKNNDQDIEKLVMFPSHVDDMRDFIWESAITHLRHLIFTVVKNYYAVKIKIDAIRDKNRNVADKAQMNRKINAKLKELRSNNLKTLKKTVRIDETMIFDYFGEEITFYFAFMNHYSKCLGFGALLSLVYYVYTKLQSVYCRYYLDVCHPDRRDVVPLLVFSVSILFGTALFIKFWERRFSYLHMKYNLFTHGDGTGANTTHNNKIEARKEFKADMIVKNKITNEFEKFYPRWKRELIKQPLSWVVLLLFTGFSLFCMVVCLNMEGMVVRVDRHHRQTDSTVTNRPTPALHIASLHRLSEDGRIFDKRQHLLGGYLPKILYSVVVMLCSQIFQVVATALNDFENYEIMSEYNKNFTIKRIFFEFFNSFGKLFFILFIRRDIEELKSSLTFIFFFSAFIRLLTCTLIPFVKTHRNIFVSKYKHDVLRLLRKLRLMKPKSNSSSPSTSPREKEKANVGLRGRHGGQWNIDAIEEEKEVNKNAPSNGSFSALDQLDEYLISDYEVYDDMIEMIIQLGFVLFFIPLFPVYSTVCVFLSNFIEVRSDLFKLCYVVKRSSNIRFGMSENVVYIYVLRIFVVIAVLINMFLFLLIYADDNLDNMPQTAPVQVEQSTDTILFAIYVEHFLIIVILFLFWRIPSVPYKVEDYLGERFYKRLISYSSNPTNNLSQRFKKEM